MITKFYSENLRGRDRLGETLQSFLTTALDGDKWSAPKPDRFTLGKEPTDSLKMIAKRKNLPETERLVWCWELHSTGSGYSQVASFPKCGLQEDEEFLD